MPTFDFTPYYRSTVGFDRLFDLLDKNIRSDWPPYNIERKSEDQYRITMTIAGFGPEEIGFDIGARLWQPTRPLPP